MNISVVREEHHNENRIALTPAAAQTLVAAGHTVYVESGAGMGAGFPDEMFSEVGAKIAYSKEEAFKRGEILLKVFPPTPDECALLPDNQTIFSFLHLAASSEQCVKIFLDRKITAIGLEVIEDEKGNLPVLTPMSELAGQMSILIASYYLSNIAGGRGILLGGAAGIPPATVVVLGAGIVGLNASKAAQGLGCNVILFDAGLERLRYAQDILSRQLVTYLPFRYNLEKVLPIADVVIGAVLIHGEMTPKLVTTDLVQKMKPGSVIVDVSIDQGGCVETSRPTTWASPSYMEHGITHFCVPNMPSNVGRTATYALANAILPYVARLAEMGAEKALSEDPCLAKGVYTFKGRAIKPSIAKRFGIDCVPISRLLERSTDK